MFEYRNKQWLIENYINNRYSLHQMAALGACSTLTISKWLKKHNIRQRTISEANKGKYNAAWIDSPLKDSEFLYLEYITNNKSVPDLVNEYKISRAVIYRLLKKANIYKDTSAEKSRKLKEYHDSLKKNYNPGDLEGDICICGDSKSKMSKQCSKCYHSSRLLQKRNSDDISLTVLLRDYLKKTWSPIIIERDKKCQLCDSTEELHAHHIIPFRYIRDRLILENAINFNLSNKEDIYKLYEICISDYRLNDIDNGITLCKRCHKKTHEQLYEEQVFDLFKYNAKIIDIKDGDSIEAELDLGFNVSITENFRLYGIDSEELSSSNIHRKGLALTSKYILEELLYDRHVVLHSYKGNSKGKYGRWLAIIEIDGIDLNKYLTHTGIVREYYL